jgi:hypothetical protein
LRDKPGIAKPSIVELSQMTVNTREVAGVLRTLLSELANGSPDPTVGTYMLNRGDEGLLASLDKLSAEAASATKSGGASIAAHTDHLLYGFSLLNRWAAGEEKPWKNADWTASWKRGTVSEAEWKTLRNNLRRETESWLSVIATPRELDEREAGWFIGTIAHFAYHVGAIRQIDRAARGPTAEDERPFQQ